MLPQRTHGRSRAVSVLVTTGILLIAAVVYCRDDLPLYMRQIRHGDPSEEVIMFRIERFVSTRGSNTADWQALRGYGGSGVYSLFVTGEFWKALLADEVLIRRLTGDSATNEYVRYVLGRSGYECYIEYHRCIPREVLKDANGLYGSELIKELDTDGLWRRNWDEFLARYRRDDGTVAY